MTKEDDISPELPINTHLSAIPGIDHSTRIIPAVTQPIDYIVDKRDDEEYLNEPGRLYPPAIRSFTPKLCDAYL
jgi:hypothetical protein